MSPGLRTPSSIAQRRPKKAKQTLEIPINLRKFRKKLGFSQDVFGATFGGYTRRQINSYETGESAIPVGLLLAVRDQGYELDVVLGPRGHTQIVLQVVGCIPQLLQNHARIRQLTDRILRTLDQENKTLKDILHRKGPYKPDPKTHRRK